MNVLLATDAFPPVCGGSGWSTFELARGLRAPRTSGARSCNRKPGREAGVREATYEDFRVLEFGSPAPNLPYVRNYFKNERLLSPARAFLTKLIVAERIDVVHGQHVLTCVPSIEAGASNAASRRSAPFATTGRSATGRT